MASQYILVGMTLLKWHIFSYFRTLWEGAYWKSRMYRSTSPQGIIEKLSESVYNLFPLMRLWVIASFVWYCSIIGQWSGVRVTPYCPYYVPITNNTSSTTWKETPKKVSIAVEKVTKKEIRNTIYFLLPITVEPITYVGIICNVEW